MGSERLRSDAYIVTSFDHHCIVGRKVFGVLAVDYLRRSFPSHCERSLFEQTAESLNESQRAEGGCNKRRSETGCQSALMRIPKKMSQSSAVRLNAPKTKHTLTCAFIYRRKNNINEKHRVFRSSPGGQCCFGIPSHSGIDIGSPTI